MTHATPTVFPLSAITKRIQEILSPVCFKTFWVRAEISGGRETGGSFYCDLVEVDGGGKVVARLRCSIWSRDLQAIRQKFAAQNMTLQLDNGTTAIFACNLTFHAQWGLSLKVVDADPSFALGELERRRMEILEGLKQDGLLDRNGSLPVPAVPMRIGLITSKGSAAYNDFIQTLVTSGYGFEVLLANAVVQGEKTEASVLNAFKRLSQSKCDIVCLVRGGGSKTDLGWFDNDKIARHIAGYNYPVWVGIGHEIDTTCPDSVAHTAFKTPTAVAEELIARCINADRYLCESRDRLKTVWDFRLQQQREWLANTGSTLRVAVTNMLETARLRLRDAAKMPMVRVGRRLAEERQVLSSGGQQLKQSVLLIVERRSTGLRENKEKIRSRSELLLERNQNTLKLASQRLKPTQIFDRLTREAERLDGKLATVKAYDPQRVLERGYSLLLDTDGKAISSIESVQTGEEVTARLHDGEMSTTVSNIKKTGDNK